MGLNGPYGKGEKGLKGWLRAPMGWSKLDYGGGGTPTFLLSLFPFLLLLLQLGKGETYSY